MDKVLTCPNCGRENDGHTPMDSNEKGPVEGDISICAYCAHVSMVKGDKLVEMKGSELSDLPEKTRMEIAYAHTIILESKKVK